MIESIKIEENELRHQVVILQLPDDLKIQFHKDSVLLTDGNHYSRLDTSFIDNPQTHLERIRNPEPGRESLRELIKGAGETAIESQAG